MSVFPRDLDEFLRRCEINPYQPLPRLELVLERAIRAHGARWIEGCDSVGPTIHLVEPEEIDFGGHPHRVLTLAWCLAWLDADRRAYRSRERGDGGNK